MLQQLCHIYISLLFLNKNSIVKEFNHITFGYSYIFIYLCLQISKTSKKQNLMKKLILWAFPLTLLMLYSCGDDELASVPKIEDKQDSISESIIPDSAIVLNTIPSYVEEALSNAKLLFDNLGETNEIKSDKIFFYTTDNNGNTLIIDTLGNADLHLNSNETIHIDSSVREKNSTTDSIYSNTVWKGWGNCYMSQYVPFSKTVPYTYYDFYDAEFEDSVYYDKTDTYTYTSKEPECTREIRFKNTTCILALYDTTKIYKNTVYKKYRKVKVKDQEYTTALKQKYKIERIDSVLYVYRLYPKDEQYTLIYTKKVDTDGSFTEDEGYETVNKEQTGFKAYRRYETYNFKILNTHGQVRLYDNNGYRESWNTGLVLQCVFDHDEIFEAIDVVLEKVQE